MHVMGNELQCSKRELEYRVNCSQQQRISRRRVDGPAENYRPNRGDNTEQQGRTLEKHGAVNSLIEKRTLTVFDDIEDKLQRQQESLAKEVDEAQQTSLTRIRALEGKLGHATKVTNDISKLSGKIEEITDTI